MLPPAQRLADPETFRAVVRSGRRAGSRTVVVHLSPGAAGSVLPARVGFVVSKAVGGAVVRNRVKRRLRHLVREHLASLPAGSVLVVRALPAAAGAGHATLAADLEHCLRRSAAVRPPVPA